VSGPGGEQRAAAAGGAGAAGVVLVHGAWHDGSCWAPLVTELEGLGLPARPVDLPSDRPGTGTGELVAAVREVADRVPGRVVLVGHSLGGLVVPVVAQEMGPERVAALVLVAALVPEPGRSWRDRALAEPGVMVPGFDAGLERRPDRTTALDPAAAADGLYAGVAEESSPAVVAAAVARLRPQDWAFVREPTPLQAWPAVPTVSVVASGDRVVAPSWSLGPGRVPGAAVVELPGGHFPMLTRPRELGEVIVRAAGGSISSRRGSG
jgi:pimeloyl-ACP methyl ester carboxylesterase